MFDGSYSAVDFFCMKMVQRTECVPELPKIRHISGNRPCEKGVEGTGRAPTNSKQVVNLQRTVTSSAE